MLVAGLLAGPINPVQTPNFHPVFDVAFVSLSCEPVTEGHAHGSIDAAAADKRLLQNRKRRPAVVGLWWGALFKLAFDYVVLPTGSWKSVTGVWFIHFRFFLRASFWARRFFFRFRSPDAGDQPPRALDWPESPNEASPASVDKSRVGLVMQGAPGVGSPSRAFGVFI